MHLLIKYFAQEKYLNEFLDGSLYMNSLNYFWDNGFEEQRDFVEGTICTVPVDKMHMIPTHWRQLQASDYRFRAKGYSYCNVLCFEKLGFEAEEELLKTDNSDSMIKFGKSIAVIHNEEEFINRVYKAVKANGFKYMCGNVKYHALKKNGQPAKEGAQIVLKSSEDSFDIDVVRNRFESVTNRDCFDKTDQYGNQREWRIALYRGLQETDAYRLEIGDIRDIVTVCGPANFRDTVQDVIHKYGVSGFEGYKSNTTKEEFRKLFCALGDNKASLIMLIG